MNEKIMTLILILSCVHDKIQRLFTEGAAQQQEGDEGGEDWREGDRPLIGGVRAVPRAASQRRKEGHARMQLRVLIRNRRRGGGVDADKRSEKKRSRRR